MTGVQTCALPIFHEGKTPDQYTFLEWDKGFSDSNINKINAQFLKENLPKETNSSLNETMRLWGEKTNYNETNLVEHLILK